MVSNSYASLDAVTHIMVRYHALHADGYVVYSVDRPHSQHSRESLSLLHRHRLFLLPLQPKEVHALSSK
jgi:hypothetical protein